MLKLLTILLLLLSISCNYFDAHPYDTKTSGESSINSRNYSLIENKLRGCEDFKFAVISDTQGWYDECADFVEAVNRRGDIDFVIHCGDISDYGLTREFEIKRDILSHLTIPYVALIGNHDCIATGEDVYNKIFGEPNFAFSAGNCRFICLNTNAMEFDYSTPVPNFDFINQQTASLSESIEHVIYAMHVRPGEFQFNNNVKEIFQYSIKQTPVTPFCIYGHEHTLRVDDLFNDGVLYYQCPNIEKRTYLLFTINHREYYYEAVDF